jgi:GT2 family glycosyltransferase
VSGHGPAPLVTIAIPTVDRLAYLEEAVASALAQTHRRVEVLIGDDGTSEAIHAWAAGASARDPRVRYQRNARRLGLAGNWNALADAARGEFLVLIGDDDRLLPEFVASLVAAADPDTAVVFSNHYLIDARGDRLESAGHTRRYHRDRLSRGALPDPRASVWQNSIPMSAALVRTDEVRRLRFDESLNTPEIEFFIRLSQAGARFVFVPEYLAEYRVHARSATSAGLWSEALATCLLTIRVDADVEPYKREFMAPLLADAVGRCLEKGDTSLARAFRSSPYYRGETGRGVAAGIRRVVQGLSAHLPPALATTVYRTGLVAWRSSVRAVRSLTGARAGR